MNKEPKRWRIFQGETCCEIGSAYDYFSCPHVLAVENQAYERILKAKDDLERLYEEKCQQNEILALDLERFKYAHDILISRLKDEV